MESVGESFRPTLALPPNDKIIYIKTCKFDGIIDQTMVRVYQSHLFGISMFNWKT
jgi:hypothetical protein